MEYRFAAPKLHLDEISRRTLDMWADLAFDAQARARLRRDGVTVSGARLTGPCPFQIALSAPGCLTVSVRGAEAADDLMDLWRIHFMRGLRLPTEAQ